MSGGSYNYLGAVCVDDLAERLAKEADLRDMADRLAELGYAKDAALETEELLLMLRQWKVRAEARVRRLSAVWHAVECSCDWSEDKVREALAAYRGEATHRDCAERGPGLLRDRGLRWVRVGVHPRRPQLRPVGEDRRSADVRVRLVRQHNAEPRHANGRRDRLGDLHRVEGHWRCGRRLRPALLLHVVDRSGRSRTREECPSVHRVDQKAPSRRVGGWSAPPPPSGDARSMG